MNEESKSILRRVERESGTLLTSELARTANQKAQYISKNISEKTDPIEIYGKYIGRAFGWIAACVLLILILQDIIILFL